MTLSVAQKRASLHESLDVEKVSKDSTIPKGKINDRQTILKSH